MNTPLLGVSTMPALTMWNLAQWIRLCSSRCLPLGGISSRSTSESSSASATFAAASGTRVSPSAATASTGIIKV